MNNSIWLSPTGSIYVHGLSDDPNDGTAQEQAEYISTLSFLNGYTLLAVNYTQFPDTPIESWTWNGNVIVTDSTKLAAFNASLVPKVVSMRQARLALLQSGLLDQVSAAVQAGSQADQITWEYATEVNRDDGLVSNLAVALGLTSQQLDDLFTLAATL